MFADGRVGKMAEILKSFLQIFKHFQQKSGNAKPFRRFRKLKKIKILEI